MGWSCMLPAGMLITDDLVLGFEWNLLGIFINLSICLLIFFFRDRVLVAQTNLMLTL